MIYNVTLFFHILGTAVMFAAVGITLTAMVVMLHSKSTESVFSSSQVGRLVAV